MEKQKTQQTNNKQPGKLKIERLTQYMSCCSNCNASLKVKYDIDS